MEMDLAGSGYKNGVVNNNQRKNLGWGVDEITIDEYRSGYGFPFSSTSSTSHASESSVAFNLIKGLVSFFSLYIFLCVLPYFCVYFFLGFLCISSHLISVLSPLLSLLFSFMSIQVSSVCTVLSNIFHNMVSWLYIIIVSSMCLMIYIAFGWLLFCVCGESTACSSLPLFFSLKFFLLFSFSSSGEFFLILIFQFAMILVLGGFRVLGFFRFNLLRTVHINVDGSQYNISIQCAALNPLSQCYNPQNHDT